MINLSEDEAVNGIVAISGDITERKLAEEKAGLENHPAKRNNRSYHLCAGE